jgi:hypothetical protein
MCSVFGFVQDLTSKIWPLLPRDRDFDFLGENLNFELCLTDRILQYYTCAHRFFLEFSCCCQMSGGAAATSAGSAAAPDVHIPIPPQQPLKPPPATASQGNPPLKPPPATASQGNPQGGAASAAGVFERKVSLHLWLRRETLKRSRTKWLMRPHLWLRRETLKRSRTKWLMRRLIF